jgi:hypothetical protein
LSETLGRIIDLLLGGRAATGLAGDASA